MPTLVTETGKEIITPAAAVPAAGAELAGDLGVWLSGLDSFFSVGRAAFSDSAGDGVDGCRKEFELLHSVLLKCAQINALIIAEGDETGVPSRELAELGSTLRDLILLGECLTDSERLGAAPWKAWRNTVAERLRATFAYAKLLTFAASAGRQNLPAPLLHLVDQPKDIAQAELALVLPGFGMVLRWLDVVGKMLETDEPLKPALIIFAAVNEQVHDLISDVNNRLERSDDKNAELFSAMDAAAYTASIELKKVFTKELAGVSQLRPTPSIYARMETAHSLLSEGCQQMLAGFARAVDPSADGLKLFPNFKIKLDRSLILRRELHLLASVVQKAELEPDRSNVDAMRGRLRRFMDEPVKYLFYKDSETVERFAEEIMIAKGDNDLVPMLHRFGAYLDTLFGQVSLRAVLSDHPFESATANEELQAVS